MKSSALLCEETNFVNQQSISQTLTITEHTWSHTGNRVLALDTEKISLLNAASEEMDYLFRSITAYANLLEGHSLPSLQETRPISKYDFDDVAEMGKNLKFVSNAFHIMVHRHPLLAQSPAEYAHIADGCVEVLDMLAPFLERRNIQLEFHNETNQPTSELDDIVARHIMWGVLFLAIKFADNEARLTVTIHREENEMLCLSCDVDRIDKSAVPRPKVDFYPCVMLQKQNLIPRLLPLISNHINTKLARYFLHRCGGRLLVQSTQKNSLRFLVLLP